MLHFLLFEPDKPISFKRLTNTTLFVLINDVNKKQDEDEKILTSEKTGHRLEIHAVVKKDLQGSNLSKCNGGLNYT